MFNRTLRPLLALVVAVIALPAFAPNHSRGQTILLISDYNAPASLGGPAGGRHDDDELVYFLGAGDPAFVGTADEGKVDFGNGVPGAPNEMLLVQSLGYTVNIDGMGGAWAASQHPFGIPIAGPSFPRLLPDNSAFDMVLFPLHRSGNYADDRYRDVGNGGNGTTLDAFGRSITESWNGLEKPLLTFNSSFANGSGRSHALSHDPSSTDSISSRFGWMEKSTLPVGDETATQMQVQPDQLSNPFYNGLTTTNDPDVPGGKEVSLFDWTYDPALGYTNGTAPPAVQLGENYYASRAPQVSPRDIANPSIGAATLGPVPGASIVSGFGGLSEDFDTEGNFDVFRNPVIDSDVDGADFLMWQRGGSWNGDTPAGMAEDLVDWEEHYGNVVEGGGFIVDMPKGTDFNVPDGMGNPTNDPGGPLQDPVPFGIAGARRVLLPTWGYSLPVLDTTGTHTWGEFQTANYFKLVENVIAEMLLNPDGAVPAVAAATVPEPTSLALAGFGLAAVSLVGRRRRR